MDNLKSELIESIVEGLNKAKYDSAWITLDNEHEVVELIADQIMQKLTSIVPEDVREKIIEILQDTYFNTYEVTADSLIQSILPAIKIKEREQARKDLLEEIYHELRNIDINSPDNGVLDHRFNEYLQEFSIKHPESIGGK
jgi:dTDP-4-dehydrorhamnose reductase